METSKVTVIVLIIITLTSIVAGTWVYYNDKSVISDLESQIQDLEISIQSLQTNNEQIKETLSQNEIFAKKLEYSIKKLDTNNRGLCAEGSSCDGIMTGFNYPCDSSYNFNLDGGETCTCNPDCSVSIHNR